MLKNLPEEIIVMKQILHHVPIHHSHGPGIDGLYELVVNQFDTWVALLYFS